MFLYSGDYDYCLRMLIMFPILGPSLVSDEHSKFLSLLLLPPVCQFVEGEQGVCSTAPRRGDHHRALRPVEGGGGGGEGAGLQVALVPAGQREVGLEVDTNQLQLLTLCLPLTLHNTHWGFLI